MACPLPVRLPARLPDYHPDPGGTLIDPDALSFGDLLRAHRLAAGLTQEELAARAGLSARAISDLERGLKRSPQRDTVRLLTTALDLAPAAAAQFAGAVPGRGQRVPFIPPRMLPLPAPPWPPTPLLGRDGELAALLDLLGDPARRVITLTGPPGVGKTHLALAAAQVARPALAGDVLFVALAGARTVDEMVAALAAALRVSESSGSPTLDTLELVLRDRPLLLVLDNCEQVPQAAPLIARLVRAVPDLQVLATSQVRLHLRSETEVVVQPLAYPPSDTTLSATALAAYPSVQLFVARMQEVAAGFALTEENARSVAAICARLEGLPLAVELAAARSLLRAPADLLPRLERRLLFLTGGARDLPERHQTLRAALDWSYELLDPAEQALFRRLAVFRGGWTLAAATAVAGEGADAEQVMDRLVALNARSLVNRQEAAGEPRFEMLETIREYAEGQLQEAGELAQTHATHAAYFASLAAAGAAGLAGSTPEPWMDRLTGEWKNLRAALAWALTGAPEAVGLPLAAHLAAYWRVNGAWSEGRYWLGEALARAGAAPPSLRAAALLGAGELAFYQGDLAAAATHLELSLALWRAEPPGPALAYTLSTLAWVRLGAGAGDAARELAAAGRRVAQEHGTLASRAWALHICGHVDRNGGDYAAATAHFAESLALWQALDHVRDTGWAMLNLGEVARSQGDYMQARYLYEAGQARFATLDDPSGQVWGQRNLGFVALAQAEIATAAAHFITCLHLYRQLGNQRGIAVTLLGLAGVAIAGKKPETAARLLGAANGLLTVLGVRLDQADHLAAGQITEAIQAALDPATYQAAVRNGRAWPPATAVSLALTLAFPAPSLPARTTANTV